MKKLLIFGMLLLNVQVFASDKGNGGDICEDNFKIIRDDIKTWILRGGPSDLKLDGIKTSQYTGSMLNAIFTAKISCVSEKVYVGAAEKVCKNYIDNTGTFQIICNRQAFLELDYRVAEEYRLVHHEYAGLAGLEVTSEEGSDYRISNQITSYLKDQVVKRLAVKPTIPGVVSCSSLDRSEGKIPDGTRCMTSQGAIYERVSHNGFGESWKGPDGLIWSEIEGYLTLSFALNLCKNMGGMLPEISDFKRGEANGFREVLPRNQYPRELLSSTLDSSNPRFGLLFDETNGEILSGYLGNTRPYHARCVAR